jgi:hypothetical protein
MSRVLEANPADAAASATTPAEQLRMTMAAMRLSFTWFGVRKTLSADQKARAAESFGAEGSYLSAGKKLTDVKHPAFRAVTAELCVAVLPHHRGGCVSFTTVPRWDGRFLPSDPRRMR